MANTTTEVQQYATVNTSHCLVLQARDFIPRDNPDNIISVHTADILKKLKLVVMVPLSFIIGVPANVINMAVFYKQGLKERINVCLFALSLADGLFLLISAAVEGEQFIRYFTAEDIYGPVNQWMINYHLVGFYGFTWVSQVLSAIVASERCFCIIQPFKSQTVLHTSTMTVIIVAIFVVVTGLRFIVVTRYRMVCAYNQVTDSIAMTITAGEFYNRNKKLVDFLDVYLYGIGVPWMVIVVVVWTTGVTVVKLRQTAKWREDMSSASENVSARDIALTRMLVGNSIFFVICVFPIGLLRFSLLFMPEMSAGRRHHNLFTAGIAFTNILSYINSTFNIVVYYTMGSRYRHTLYTMLGRRKTKYIASKISSASVKPSRQ